MKLIDKFLEKLNADRNTFATYILTLITIYLAVDRIVEMLFMIFTGVSISYWHPFQYTAALACPIFAFLFSGASSFAKVKNAKITLFYTYVIGLYVIALSMFTQWLNMIGWLLLISVPSYVELVTDFSDLIKPAFTALSLYLPLISFYPVIRWLVLDVNDNKDMKRSIWDYYGINLSNPKKGLGPYTCETILCQDKETGAKIVIPEEHRYQSLFVCGGSGTGKTSLVFEPLIARDLEKKYFFKEVSKEMGYTALKTGIAVLNSPYSSDYINENFSLTMLSPAFGKDTIYKAYMKKMLLSSDSDMVYRNIGVTSISPDFETISHMIEICNNFKLKYNLIDPSSPDSIGLNPFIYDDPSKIAVTISSVLKGMYNTVHEEIEEAYKEDVTLQAIENLSILLKEMYPRMNNGSLPNLQDLLKMLTNFELVEKMCEILKTNSELAEKYAVQLSYFEKSFYSNGKNKEQTEQNVLAAVTQLDNLLRLPGVKSVLCNRHNNIDFDKMLANGEITFVCTRRGDIGATSHKAFGSFFMLSMQNAVLRRPGNEKTRVPNFFYMDEFSDFISKETEPIFTMYRKYRVGTTISVQNLGQLEAGNQRHNFRSLILSNCANKIFLGNATPEELNYWEAEIGKRRTWVMTNSFDASKLEYDSKKGNVKWDWENITPKTKLGTLPFKACAYKIKDSNNRVSAGEGMLNFVEAKYKEPHNVKTYNFSKFISSAVDDEDESRKDRKFNPSKVDFSDEKHEVDPVQMNTSDSKYLFDNEDAVSFTFKKKNKK